MLPIPKYLRTKNIITHKVEMIPLLVFAKRIDKVKRRERKTIKKKTGIAPKVWGSTK